MRASNRVEPELRVSISLMTRHSFSLYVKCRYAVTLPSFGKCNSVILERSMFLLFVFRFPRDHRQSSIGVRRRDDALRQ